MRKFEVNVEALREYVVDGKTLEEIKNRYDPHAMDERGQYFRTVNKRGGWGKKGNYCGVRYRDMNGCGWKFTDEDFDDYVKKFRSRRGSDAYTIDEYIETELGGQIITEGEYKKLQNSAVNPKAVKAENKEAYNSQLKKSISGAKPAFFDKAQKAEDEFRFSKKKNGGNARVLTPSENSASYFGNAKLKAKSILKKFAVVSALLLVGIVLLINFFDKQFSNISSEYIFDIHVYGNQKYYGDERFGKPNDICLKKTFDTEFILANFRGGNIHNVALHYQDFKVTLGQFSKDEVKGYGAVCDKALKGCRIGKFKDNEINGYGLYYDGAKLYGAKYEDSKIVKKYEIKKNKFKGYKIEKLNDGYAATVKKKKFTIQPDSVAFSYKNYYSSYSASGDCYLSNERRNGKQYVRYNYNVNGIFDVKSHYALFGFGQYRELSNSTGKFIDNVTSR